MKPAAAAEKTLHVTEIIAFFHAFQQNAFDAFPAADDGILRREGLDGLDLAVGAEGAEHRIVLFYGQSFRERGFIAREALDADVPPQIEHFLTDGILKAIGKGQRKDHGPHADHGRADRQPDNEPGEGPLTVESDSSGYKGGYIQWEDVINW